MIKLTIGESRFWGFTANTQQIGEKSKGSVFLVTAHCFGRGNVVLIANQFELFLE